MKKPFKRTKPFNRTIPRQRPGPIPNTPFNLRRIEEISVMLQNKMTQEEIGLKLGITRARVCQLVNQAKSDKLLTEAAGIRFLKIETNMKDRVVVGYTLVIDGSTKIKVRYHSEIGQALLRYQDENGAPK